VIGDRQKLVDDVLSAPGRAIVAHDRHDSFGPTQDWVARRQPPADTSSSSSPKRRSFARRMRQSRDACRLQAERATAALIGSSSNAAARDGA